MSIKDDLIKHKIFLQRYGKNLSKNLTKHLNVVYNYVEQSLARRDVVERQKIAKLFDALKEEALNELSALAPYEYKVASKLLVKHSISATQQSVSDDTINKAVNNAGMLLTAKGIKNTMPGNWALFASKKTSQINQLLLDNAGQEPADVTSKTKELIGGLILTQLLVLTYTSVNHTSATTQTLAFKNGNVDYVRWTSVLDNHVCEDCENLDGTIASVDESEQPPLHAGCRCQLVPVDTING